MSAVKVELAPQAKPDVIVTLTWEQARELRGSLGMWNRSLQHSHYLAGEFIKALDEVLGKEVAT